MAVTRRNREDFRNTASHMAGGNLIGRGENWEYKIQGARSRKL